MSSGNNQGEPAFTLLMMVALVVGLCWLVWHNSHDFWMTYFFRWLRYAELWPLHLATGHYGACLDWLRQAQLNQAQSSIVPLTETCFGPRYLASMPLNVTQQYYILSMPPLIALGDEAMRFYRWPVIIACVLIALYITFMSPRSKFGTKHTLESLIKTQAKMWPVIAPIINFNPTKTGRILGDMIPDKLPMFAEALSPEEWLSWCQIGLTNGIPDRDAVRRAFIRQLGPRWNGLNSLPVHIRGLMAAFALKGSQKRDRSDEFLGKLALAWSPEKGFRPSSELTTEINQILSDAELGGKIVPIADRYAYRVTAILGVLKWARANGGVLAPAQFIWMRGEDRALWYPLNNLGRRSFHSEGAGAMAHFMEEDAARKPLPIPRVDTAIVTLNTYLHDPDKKPIPLPPREGDAKKA
jgi:intracellular multiplication protein IcmP